MIKSFSKEHDVHERLRLNVHRYSILDIPVAERFDAWAANSRLCDFVAAYRSELPLDAHRDYVAIGPLTLARRAWRHPDKRAAYAARRTSTRIRGDQQDFLSFSLQLDGHVGLQSHGSACIKRPGELYVLDFARPFERTISSGSELSLTVPRDLLPAGADGRHGHSLEQGTASLLMHYLLQLYGTVPQLTTRDAPHIVQATLHLLTATLQPERPPMDAAERPIQSAQRDRVRRYIEAHLLQPHLTADRICRDMGISRATLYRLFAETGGIMREIRRRRLVRVHEVLAAISGTSERVRDVAYRHGFTDEKYFARIFKAQFGHTPSETLDGGKRPDHASAGVSTPGKPDTPP
ncbi:helix-turn-helix domain-containing protein [Burkholderia gladioli]|uniref:helix-turn-helix domain-containing protein n=1 Tax=Burkholderia gladioli TaxID=28095 RepID=UPI0016408446|nr:helix-turn-helix domain-containing protein [Burkholderia gladioli]